MRLCMRLFTKATRFEDVTARGGLALRGDTLRGVHHEDGSPGILYPRVLPCLVRPLTVRHAILPHC